MKKSYIFLILIFLVRLSWSQPLPSKINHTIIIDTDGAIDDMRAISYLLATPGDYDQGNSVIRRFTAT